MQADQLLIDLGQAAGLAQPLRLDAQGCARLLFDGSLAIDFEHDAAAGVLQVYCVLGPLPAEGREALFLDLLRANLFGAETAGATLAVDGEQQEAVLCRTVPLEDAGSAAFVRTVEQFVAVAEDWKARLAGAPGASAQPAAVPVPAVAAGMFMRA